MHYQLASSTDDWKHGDIFEKVASNAFGGASTTDDCSDVAGYLSDDEEQPTIERTDTFTQYNEISALEWAPHFCSQVQAPVAMLPPIVSCEPAERLTRRPPAAEYGNSFCDAGKNELGSAPISSNWREVMKLRKKLREIEKLQERLARGEMLDHLQLAKLEKHGDVLAEIARSDGDCGTDGQFQSASPDCDPRISSYEAFERRDVSVDAANTATVGPDWSRQAFATQSDPFAWTPFSSIAPVHTSAQEDPKETAFCQSDYVSVHSPPAERGLMFDLVAQAQQHAEVRAAQETGCQRQRRRGTTKHSEGSMMSRTSFADRVDMLAQGLLGSGAVQEETLAAIGCASLQLALDVNGCRVLQHALGITDLSAAAQLSAGLRGHVRELIHSPHGNYVLQKVVEVLPIAQASFISQELLGAGAEFARHRFGCRILCRLLEHSAGDEAGSDVVTDLVTEVVEDAISLSRHNFGRHVMQSVVEHGRPGQRHEVIRRMCRDLPRNLMNRNASFVIENILIHCSVEERQMIIDEFALCGSEVRAALAAGGRVGFASPEHWIVVTLSGRHPEAKCTARGPQCNITNVSTLRRAAPESKN
jgi:hypothetical protein